MESRRDICSKCRHRLRNPEASNCPVCEKVSPNRASNNSGGVLSPPQNGRICREIIRHIVHRKLESQLTSPSSSPNHVRPNKRALLIGITYKNWKYKLKGTVNDVNRMKAFLIVQYKFPVNNIRVLTEDEQDPCRTPTKTNIKESLKWLVEGCEDGDSLVFYFAGHGVRIPDFKKDESDGFDEAICPVDFQTKGLILDDDINSTIVWPLTKGVTLHAFVDSCYSGTILDLVHVYNLSEKRWVNDSPPSGTRKHPNGGLAICISACEDDQVAADTSVFSEGDEANGALTYLLVEILREQPEISYGILLESIHAFLDEANKSGGRLTKILRKLFNRRLLQKPLLSASKQFNIYEKKFAL